MTVPAQGYRASFAANGVTVDFPYGFKFAADGDLDVYVINNATGVAVLKILITDYTVTGAGDPLGGNVHFLAAPAAAHTVLIVRSTVATQGLDLQNSGTFFPESIETALDRAIILLGEILGRLDRAAGLDAASLWAGSLALPTPIAGYFLAVTDDGLALEWRSVLPTWRSGAGAPAAGLGFVGDFYIDTLNGNFYEKTATATWTLRGNLMGPAGAGGDAPYHLTSVVAGVNTITATPTPAISAYPADAIFVLRPAANITGPATLNLRDTGGVLLGALDITKPSGDPLDADDIVQDTDYMLRLVGGAAGAFRIVAPF